MKQPANVELQTEPLDKREHIALKACSEGTAEPHQQVLAIEIILKKFARSYEMAYIPGDTHASAFLAGRGFVGQRLTKYLNQPLKEDQP
jgi:hypothetical protein